MALWQTKSFDLHTGLLYRINVLLDGRLLGFADVRLGANGADRKNVDTDQFIPLKDGQSLPIKFWLNGCAPVVCASGDACRAAAVCDPGSMKCVAGKPQPNGTTCSDGDRCSQTDTCQAGTCTGGNPVT